MLAATGFDGTAAAQAAGVAPAIRMAMTAVLVAGGILTIIALIPYDLTAEKYDKMLEEIQDRKKDK